MEDYEVKEEIGSGSFGKVYKARRKASNEIVAIKKISKGGMPEREIRSLRQEYEIQKELHHHPNIIKMLDSFETDDLIVVVTECAQKDLGKHMENEGQLPEIKMQIFAHQLVSALYFLHSNGIIHRDIKPQNVLIGRDGNAKLCDFGFARTMGMYDYVLTSMKGTPLYMAPEIVENKPYDQNIDLWSLGCILYQLMVGTPPFLTSALLELAMMIKYRDIYWPEYIAGDCLSFLKGLLTKDPKKRLQWPNLLHHPFVRDRVYITETVGEFSLTKALSPSQELVKERQREHLQRKLDNYKELIAKTERKFKAAEKKLKCCSEEGRMGIRTRPPLPIQFKKIVTPLGSPNPLVGVPPQNFPHAHQDANHLKVMLRDVNTQQGKPLENKKERLDAVNDNNDDSDPSSCETMTSSSDDSDDGDEDARTVIMDAEKGKGSIGSNVAELDSRGGSAQLWKSGVLFTLHSFGSEDKPINSDEWIHFLATTMKEVSENPQSLCEKHFLTILLGPLQNHLAEPEVIEKIASLLSLPFTMDESRPGLLKTLLTLYLDTKILPNLIYSCKLIVRRRVNMESGPVTFEDIPSILTSEDIDGLEKCLRLVAFLVYMDEDFVNQLCDSVYLLQGFALLKLFLNLDAVRPDLTANTVAILCHILRTLPSPPNRKIVEEIILDENDNNNSTEAHNDFWRLVTHSNTTIQCRSIRLFTHLRLNSERTKTEFLSRRRPNLWKVFRTAFISEDADLRSAAKFALNSFKHPPTTTVTLTVSSKLNSTTSNSGCRNGLEEWSSPQTNDANDGLDEQKPNELQESQSQQDTGSNSLPLRLAEKSSNVELLVLDRRECVE